MNNVKFNPRELCSRKLWQLVSTEKQQKVGEKELRQAVAELAARRHYLEQLQQMGVLENSRNGA